MDNPVAPGDTAVLVVNVDGRNLVYQWYRVVVGGDDMALTDIPGSLFGADSDTLIITDVTEVDHEGAMYYVVISNSAGEVESNRAAVFVGKCME